MSKKCKDCKYLSYMLDPWSDASIRVICNSLGTATNMDAPDGWDESMPLPIDIECAFDLGTSNHYCQG